MKSSLDAKQQKIILVETVKNDATVKEQYIICEVCGHANKLTNSLCSKCSNYLHN